MSQEPKINFIDLINKNLLDLRDNLQRKLPTPPPSPSPPTPENVLFRFGIQSSSPTSSTVSSTVSSPVSTLSSLVKYKSDYNKDTSKLIISSLNCGYKIIKCYFYKVQINDTADPLINEVIFTKVLTNAQKGKNKIFPEYKDHFISGNGQKVLVTRALTKPQSLGSYINDKIKSYKTNYDSEIIALLNDLLNEYEYYGIKLGFIHCDLHFNNIQLSNGKPYIIDFGRSYIHVNEIGLDLNVEKDKFELTKPINLSNPLGFTNLLGDNHGYLCDFAMVAINLLRANIVSDVRFLNITIETKDGGEIAVVNVYNVNVHKHICAIRKYLKENQNDSPITRGLIWAMCYINACLNHEKYGVFINSQLFDKTDKEIIKLKLNFMFNMTLFARNGLIMPTIYKHDEIKKATIEKYKEICETGTRGGKKLNSIKKNTIKKMKGGTKYCPGDHDVFNQYMGVSFELLAAEFVLENLDELKKIEESGSTRSSCKSQFIHASRISASFQTRVPLIPQVFIKNTSGGKSTTKIPKKR
jgi:hypothetical protein